MLRLLLPLFLVTFWVGNLPAFEVHGHRGARGYFPENTIPAFEHALKIGVDVLELDVVISKDDIPIVNHDPVINKFLCLDKNGKKIETDLIIRQLTYKKIKEFDCGSIKNPKFPKQTILPGTKIPSLEEVFELVKQSKLPNAKTIRFNIETKSNPDFPKLQPSPEKFAKILLKLIKSYHLNQRVIIQSFDHRTLVEVKKQNPLILTSALFHEDTGDVVMSADKIKANIISSNYKWLHPKLVEEAKAKGIKIIPYTPNDKSEWETLIKMNVDGIITDYPDDLIEFIKKH